MGLSFIINISLSIEYDLPGNPIGHCHPHKYLRVMRRSDLKRISYFLTIINFLQIFCEIAIKPSSRQISLDNFPK